MPDENGEVRRRRIPGKLVMFTGGAGIKDAFVRKDDSRVQCSSLRCKAGRVYPIRPAGLMLFFFMLASKRNLSNVSRFYNRLPIFL